MLSFKESKKWLDSLRNEQTKHNYVRALFTYCQEIQLSPSELITEKAKATQNINLRGLAEDRLKQWHRLKERTSPGMANLTFKAVRAFFKENYLPLGCKIPTYVKQREEDYIPSKKESQQMIKLADLETATFTLIAAESGHRNGELGDLTLNHVKECLDGQPPYCFVVPQKRNPKTGKIVKSKRIYGKYGFICEDAVESLELMLKTKLNLKPTDKIFSYEAQTYSKNISDIAVKLGINPKTGLKPFKFHNLRMRAQTLMEDAEIPQNWVDRLICHKPRGSQGSVYSQPPKERLFKKFRKAMPLLTIFGKEQEANNEIQELKARVAKLEKTLEKRAR